VPTAGARNRVATPSLTAAAAHARAAEVDALGSVAVTAAATAAAADAAVAIAHPHLALAVSAHDGVAARSRVPPLRGRTRRCGAFASPADDRVPRGALRRRVRDDGAPRAAAERTDRVVLDGTLEALKVEVLPALRAAPCEGARAVDVGANLVEAHGALVAGGENAPHGAVRICVEHVRWRRRTVVPIGGRGRLVRREACALREGAARGGGLGLSARRRGPLAAGENPLDLTLTQPRR